MTTITPLAIPEVRCFTSRQLLADDPGKLDGLGDHLAAIDAPMAVARRLAAEHVEVDGLEVQDVEQFVGLSHRQKLALGMSFSRGATLSLSDRVTSASANRQSMPRSGSFHNSAPSVWGAYGPSTL